jgi:myosin heavy subunit
VPPTQTEHKDQTILVSGDSGSGKTESTKFMMQYLAAVAHSQKSLFIVALCSRDASPLTFENFCQVAQKTNSTDNTEQAFSKVSLCSGFM